MSDTVDLVPQHHKHTNAPTTHQELRHSLSANARFARVTLELEQDVMFFSSLSSLQGVLRSCFSKALIRVAHAKPQRAMAQQ